MTSQSCKFVAFLVALLTCSAANAELIFQPGSSPQTQERGRFFAPVRNPRHRRPRATPCQTRSVSWS
jgi:hypothetical protein